MPNAAGLGINWQCFGSNGEEKADYSRGVLERFTRRAPSDWNGSSGEGGNTYRKVIEIPRYIRYRINPHFSYYFEGKTAVNSNGESISTWYGNKPILADKIVLNHYFTKSLEEWEKKKLPKGSCCKDGEYVMENFHQYDRNEVFDDEILKYQVARVEIFLLEDDADRIRRVEKTMTEILTQYSPFDAPEEFFTDKLETFLTCRAVAEKLGTKVYNLSVEEYTLLWIYHALLKMGSMTRAEFQLFMSELPKILTRPFPIVKKIKMLTQEFVIPNFCEALKNGDVFRGTNDWQMRFDTLYTQKLLCLIN